MKKSASTSFTRQKNTRVARLWVALLLLSAALQAQGDLLVFPKRVVFENGKKTETLNLVNRGEDTATYKISFVQVRMTETGAFETITEPDEGQNFADPYIRFYPRSVRLAPGESQVVKLQLIKSGNLAPGEYRSHLYLRAEPSGKNAENKTPADSGSVSVRLTPIYGLTVPTIIRAGATTGEVALENLSLLQNPGAAPSLSLELHRSGSSSVYGTLTVEHISPEGAVAKVGEVAGLAVYTPGTRRKCILPLRPAEGVDLTKGQLKVIYSAPPEAKSRQLASAFLYLF